MKTVLIFSYYFPPMGLGGVQRTLKFAKYLPQFGWRPLIVTVKDVSYHGHDETLLEELPPDATVYRTGSYDPLRLAHRLKIRSSKSGFGASVGDFSRWLLVPDKQIGWMPFALSCARDIMNAQPVDAVFSTFPPASAHLVAARLRDTTDVPWVADYRDSWQSGEFSRPPSRLHGMVQEEIGRRCAARADRIICVTDHIAAQISEYRGGSDGVSVISNGFDAEDFEGMGNDSVPGSNGFRLTYCGSLTVDRNPEPLFKAVRWLLDRYPEIENEVTVTLVGAAIGLDLDGLVSYYRLEKVVRLSGYVTHRESVRQLVRSDAVLMLITSPPGRSRGVPTGKYYECLASGRPILCVSTNRQGLADIEETGQGAILDPSETEAIARYIKRLIEGRETGVSPETAVSRSKQFNRLNLAERLGRILDEASYR